MKLLTYETSDGPRCGVLHNDDVVDVSALIGAAQQLPDVRALLELGDSAIGRAAAERCGEFTSSEYSFVELDGISHWVPEEAPARLAAEIIARVRAA